jgi:hypothetical protein
MLNIGIRYTKFRYTEFCYVKCCYAENHLLSVVTLSDFTLGLAELSALKLRVVMSSVIMLSALELSVVIPSIIMLRADNVECSFTERC